MRFTGNLPRILGAIMVIALLAGCGAPAAAPTATRPLPPLPPPPQKTLPPPQSPLPPPTPDPAEKTPGQAELFRFVKTVQVTPDENYVGGGFVRIFFVPATNRFVVTFGATLATSRPDCLIGGVAYKEYGLDMQPTGKTGILACELGDMGATMVENDYYLVIPEIRPVGWHVRKYDAADWTLLAETQLALEEQNENKYPNNDPMAAYVNGRLDISSQYQEAERPPAFTEGAATYHDFFSTGLVFQEQMILDDTPHICGSSMVYADGVYYLVATDAYLEGSLVVISYDENWKYLGVKKLKSNALWPQGTVYDGQRFYVAYLDNSQTLQKGDMPVYLNVRLAAFDRDWNLVDDIAVTDYAIADNMQTGRPWVMLHAGRLYVAYDLDEMDPEKRTEMKNGQAIVSVYDLLS